MAVRTGRFRRTDRLTCSREFQRVHSHGRRAVGREFVVVLAARGGAPSTERSRLGVSVSRRVGDAVTRNRVKRRIREWFRTAQADWDASWDVVVIARPHSAGLSTQLISESLEDLVRSLRSAGR